MSAPHFSILTPTICRPSIERMCRSLDEQTFMDWEHLIAVDRRRLSATQRELLEWDLEDMEDRRSISWCAREHRDYGHTCRVALSAACTGTYVLYLDDDDFLADAHVLQDLAGVTSPWAVFPVLREGNVFFDPIPKRCSTTLSSFIARREFAQFPVHDGTLAQEQLHQLDANLIERLVAEAGPPEVLWTRPLVIIPKPGLGED